MEEKLQECRAKAGIVADMKAQSSVEGSVFLDYVKLVKLFITCNHVLLNVFLLSLQAQHSMNR